MCVRLGSRPQRRGVSTNLTLTLNQMELEICSKPKTALKQKQMEHLQKRSKRKPHQKQKQNRANKQIKTKRKRTNQPTKQIKKSPHIKKKRKVYFVKNKHTDQ